MKDELRKIKKKYGEEMSHLCRELFPTILEETDCLYNILISKFSPSKQLYKDIIDHNLVSEFKNYIYGLWKPSKLYVSTTKTPKQLLDEAGYKLFECKTEEEIQAFKKYYADGEQLCTFNGNRLERCHVFFAVRKDVDKIKRENYDTPEREDEYGTSVISIQFTKGRVNTLSIKNRYNHHVNNPDATFQNNLDNIIEGLTDSFAKEYNLNINSNINNFCITEYDYILASDKRFYKFNYECDNVYYCPNNIIIDNGEVIKKYTDKSRYIMFDYFILDMMNKEFVFYRETDTNVFLKYFNNNILKVSVTKLDNGFHKIIITTNEGDVYLTINNENRLVEYENKYIEKLEYGFLKYNKTLKKLDVPNVKQIDGHVLFCNLDLEELNIPNVESIGHFFLDKNSDLETFRADKLRSVGTGVLRSNQKIRILNLPSLISAGDNLLSNNIIIGEVNCPNLQEVGDFFLDKNRNLKKTYFPNLIKVGNYFISCNLNIESFIAPKLEIIGKYFLESNQKLSKLCLPSVTEIDEYFMEENDSLVYLNLPNVIRIYPKFLIQNEELVYLNIPKATNIGEYALFSNKKLEYINMSDKVKYGVSFLETHPMAYNIKVNFKFYDNIENQERRI